MTHEEDIFRAILTNDWTGIPLKDALPVMAEHNIIVRRMGGISVNVPFTVHGYEVKPVFYSYGTMEEIFEGNWNDY